MNIQFQLCGLCILSLLLIFYKSHTTLRLYNEKVFYSVMRIMTVSLVGDVLSLVVIRYRSFLPALLVTYLCKSYIVTLIWGAWSALIYVLTDIFAEKKHRKISRRLAVLASLQSVFIYFLPIYIFEEGREVYTYGPAALGVYAFSLLYIIATLTVSMVFGRRMNSRRRFATALWMLIWLSSAAIQFFVSELLIVGFSSALGVLIMFVLMENPEANLERRLGCFNAYALTEYMKQLYEQNAEFSILELSLDNTKLLEEQGLDTNEIMREIIKLIGKDILVFKNVNLSLVLISEQEAVLENAGNAILDSFADTGVFREAAAFVLTSQTGAFTDMEEQFRFLAFVREEHKDECTRVIRAGEDMVVRYREQSVLEHEITEALQEDRVEVFLQPIYSNQEMCFIAAEALARIRKRNGELLHPGQFIPLAEENGQIQELGERVFEKVCRYLKDTDPVKTGLRYIEVNLSVVQCEKADLAERLMSISEKYRINPGYINLEITETASVNARKTLLENMKRMIGYGFTFSLDDFGEGQSNLMYVVEMPVSIVKLDFDIIKAYFVSPKARQVVSAVVGMAHGMGLRLVAEGIETEEEAREMRQEGIDYIQGFLYSRPLPMPEFQKFLESQRRNTRQG